MTQRVVLVRHDDGPDDDRIVSYLERTGLQADIRRPFKSETLGDVTDDVAGTVVYGGMYNAYDTELHPFLNDEYRWIGAALDAGVPLLGLCQGAQMLARHQGAWAGARPGPAEYEFGMYQITPTADAGDFLSAPLYVTQAHYHTFDLPDGAVHLARSAAYDNQAFRLGEAAYGFQFHPEQTVAGFRRWQDRDTGAYGSLGAQTRAEQTRLLEQHDAAQATWFYDFLDGFFGQAGRAQ